MRLTPEGTEHIEIAKRERALMEKEPHKSVMQAIQIPCDQFKTMVDHIAALEAREAEGRKLLEDIVHWLRGVQWVCYTDVEPKVLAARIRAFLAEGESK